MDRTVWEVHRLDLDGVLFRTEVGQNRKKTEMKTDNSCIIGWTEVLRTNIKNKREKRRGNKNATQKEKCYGRIQRLYVHFMYPPGIT